MARYILLGIVQGFTEFLPISSSGHLIILQKILGLEGQEIAVLLTLHLGTILALILFFFKDILKAFANLRLISLILIATVITGIIGIAGKDFFERMFGSVVFVCIAWLITGVILILTRRFTDTKRDILGVGDSFVFGLVQAISIMPGISRSGITISSLLFRKVDKQTCFKFSFLASIPVIMGATLLELKNIDFAMQTNFFNFFAGFLASMFSGICALWILRLMLYKSKLHYFGYYCIVAALITLLFLR